MRQAKSVDKSLDPELARIVEARHHDPFTVLGRRPSGEQEAIRVFVPGAGSVRIEDGGGPMRRIADAGLFEWLGEAGSLPAHYRVTAEFAAGRAVTFCDPYSFGPQLHDYDLYLFGEGSHWHAWRILGAHPRTVDGIQGVLFSTWAPNAGRVSVVGDFNNWDGRKHCMRSRGGGGVWEIFIPGLAQDALYKFEIRNNASGSISVKSDPYGLAFERRPKTAAVVSQPPEYEWNDAEWMQRRRNYDWQHEPVSIYEVHLGSWRRGDGHGFLGYRELAHRLVEHVGGLGFTHIELLPVTEHPLDASWGYQTTGYFAPTSRHGKPADFAYFVDYCHRNGIGVILDWVPGHFPKDEHSLARFDGSALYEHEDPRRGEHREWGTLIFNYGRNEVRTFLLSSALFWLEMFHLDGLRVDAVASMLYLDYSRKEGEWLPNIHGGRENLEAIDFLREFNKIAHDQHPGVLIIAEESTAWPQVTRPTWLGGLGFSAKWNMGWMHDSLQYISLDPVHRKYHHERLTFAMLYAFTENFVLPFSHDEVVHGKGSLIGRMPGDTWQRFANLRLLYTYMFTWPGKKLLFMGCEIAQWTEWNHDATLDWALLEWPNHEGIHRLVGDLNSLYRSLPALHHQDFETEGFAWIDCHDAGQSVLSYLRTDGRQTVAVIINFTPVPRDDYRIGLPHGGGWKEILNSDADRYAGSNLGNAGHIEAEPRPWMGLGHSATLTLPPLAGVILLYQPD